MLLKKKLCLLSQRVGSSVCRGGRTLLRLCEILFGGEGGEKECLDSKKKKKKREARPTAF